jgi:hypothetical protein
MPYGYALALTLAVEVPVYAVCLRAAGLLSLPRAAGLAVLVNLLTHPIVWYGLSRGGPAWFGPAEIGAVLVEAAVCRAVIRRDTPLLLLVSLVANTASILAGLAVARAALR